MAELQTKATGTADFDPLRWLVQEPQTTLNEDGEEDDEDADGDPEEDDDAEDEGTDTETDRPEVPEKKPFENLELVDCTSFGWCRNAANDCWCNLADSTISKGWSDETARRIDSNMEKDVDASFYFLTVGTFRDLDTDYVWRASFVNQHSLWKLELADGSAPVLPEDAQAFFACEYFKKFSKRGADLICQALYVYDEIVDLHIKEGELLQVDPVKLEKILALIGNKRTMENYRNGKYEMS